MAEPTRTQEHARVGQRPARAPIPVRSDPDLERFDESLQGSRTRRDQAGARRTPGRTIPRIAIATGLALALTIGLAVGAAQTDRDVRRAWADGARGEPAASQARSQGHGHAGARAFPGDVAFNDAWGYARDRGGLISLAAIDSEGRLHSFDGARPYVSASVVKALLLAAELRRLDSAGLALDAATRAQLAQMVTLSDNDAADAVYSRVGDAGLVEIARRAGMQSFSVSGYWGNAQITADDMARFMWRLERVLAGPHREFGLGLLGSIVSSQRWGIPLGAPGWAVRFKGGWRATDLGQQVHQAAELRRDGRRISLAVLTDAQPSQPYAIETLRGVAERLVSRSGRDHSVWGHPWEPAAGPGS